MYCLVLLVDLSFVSGFGCLRFLLILFVRLAFSLVCSCWGALVLLLCVACVCLRASLLE